MTTENITPIAQIALFESELHDFALVEGLYDNEKHFYIRGKFATIETLNNNKRVYPRHLWEREVAKYQTQIENGTVNTLMEWEHPKGRLTVEPKNAIAKITKLWIEGDYVMGEAVIFDNPQAETIKSMIKHGVKISVSSRASGSVGAGGIVKDFNLITFDIVTNPSDQSATMSGVLESEELGTPGTPETQDKENTMADEALMENLVGILRSKNVEIEDLKREIEMLGESLADAESQIRNYEELGVGHTDLPYGNDANRGYLPYDDHPNRYHEELEDIINKLEVLKAIEDHHHQDVSSTLHDSDPSGYYASGENHPNAVLELRKALNRASVIGAQLGYDVSGIGDLMGASGKVTDPAVPAQTGKDREMNESRGLNESIRDDVDIALQAVASRCGFELDWDGKYAANRYNKVVPIVEVKSSRDRNDIFKLHRTKGIPTMSGEIVDVGISDGWDTTFGEAVVTEFIVNGKEITIIFAAPKPYLVMAGTEARAKQVAKALMESSHGMNESTKPAGNRFLSVPSHLL